ncbi:MAG: hypothetical protein AB7S26_17895 [Sandaracinaceae bacterium]
MERDAIAARIEEAASRLDARWSDSLALSRDRDRSRELTREARPLLEALIEGIASCDEADAERPELRESLALASLLGRRAAALGATPTATSRLADALLAAVPEAAPIAGPIREVMLEGFLAEREDDAEARGAARAAGAIALVEIASGCFLLPVAGDQDADRLEARLEEIGRALLERGAIALVVHVGGLGVADPERAARLFGVHETCAFLGVRCHFAEVGEPWLVAARERGLATDDLTIHARFADALDRALDEAGHALGPKRGWVRLTSWLARRRA